MLLQSLDAQLAAADLLGEESDVPQTGALTKHREIIVALRRGACLRLWSEAALPRSVDVMEAVPGLSDMPPMDAARLVAEACGANGDDRPAASSDLRKRVRMRAFRQRLVGAIRKKAAAAPA
jgi:hypothetical protein